MNALPLRRAGGPFRAREFRGHRFRTWEEVVREYPLPKRRAGKIARLRRWARGTTAELLRDVARYRRLANAGPAALEMSRDDTDDAYEWAHQMCQLFNSITHARSVRPAFERWAREEGAL